MKKVRRKTPVVDLGFKPFELARTISASAISQGKKLAYLYALADGSFSLGHFDRLLAEMEVVGTALQERKKIEESRLNALKKQQSQTEWELIELQIKAAEEQERNVEKLLVALARETEQEKEAEKKKKIVRLKTKLRKQT